LQIERELENCACEVGMVVSLPLFIVISDLEINVCNVVMVSLIV
jgi:hypothetical protein